MAFPHSSRATLDDLYREPGKAELIQGRIKRLPPMGYLPNLVAGRILRSLADFAEQRGKGEAYTGSMGFAVPELPSGRESFSPDASYFTGPLPADAMRFVEGPPTLAVEVRGAADYSVSTEVERAAKRADYFLAGTQVVWDVDPLGDRIAVYRPEAPDQPIVYSRGGTAEAEPAVPGWRVAVDWIFR